MFMAVATSLVMKPNLANASERIYDSVNIEKIDQLNNPGDYREIVIGKNYTGSLEKLFHVFINSTEKITIDKDNPKYASVDGVVFSKDMKQILYYPRNKNVGGSYTIPETVEKIGKMAFKETAIKEVKMGNKINTISQKAFDGSSILEVKIPDKVKTLGAAAFSSSKITNIDLNNVKKNKIRLL